MFTPIKDCFMHAKVILKAVHVQVFYERLNCNKTNIKKKEKSPNYTKLP